MPWSASLETEVSCCSWSRRAENVPFPRSWNLSAPPQRADGFVGWGDWEAGQDKEFEEYANLFYTDARSIEIYKAHLEKVIARRNSITGRLYSEDATIMAWEPINEPQLSGKPNETDAMVVWHNDIAAYIKARAPRQLLTTGFEAKQGPVAYKSLHKSKDVDYGCGE